ncbi:hypothetical protein [Brevibacillus reuszeri]|nr:hypothetical protein [Brevibacillus reuszeri]KNB73159.1 hypothetical protein ADS79_04065 [Brevibacillus reuszeri]MED1856754.1 hypothetical protein [Brevibacillus reuszeri]
MDKQLLLEIAKSINCEYEIGIWSETTDFLERQKNISFFEIKYNEGHFQLNIKLSNFNLNEVKSIFTSLVRFLEYNSTLYVREDKDSSIEYYFLSSMLNKKGFLFHVIFQ